MQRKLIELVMDEKYCAVNQKFCRMFSTRKFGTVPHCSLYMEDLSECETTGKVLRCEKCLVSYQKLE